MENILRHIPDRDFDKACILEDFGRITRETAALHGEREVPPDLCQKVLGAANTRALGYPLQYILGEWEFYGLKFRVGEGVLIPRADTETLVELSLLRLRQLHKKLGRKLHVIDLCSGSGCVAVSIAKEMGEAVQMYAVELSGEAFPYLLENVRRNNVNVRLFRGDVMDGRMLDNFRDPLDDDRFIPIDAIVSNPPYLTDDEMSSLQREVTFEPETALYGGTDGLKFYRVTACMWNYLLSPGGLMIFEVGDSQAAIVSRILEENGFGDIFTQKDGAGVVRAVGGRFIKQHKA
ncbi:MAG: peptide chain release factor N(5)-glutamine methyltransferase [Ruminococcus sp.]|nr:peptide chain release factor N(5)-glutamine methyltransferase [Ruminococcus sp.]